MQDNIIRLEVWNGFFHYVLLSFHWYSVNKKKSMTIIKQYKTLFYIWYKSQVRRWKDSLGSHIMQFVHFGWWNYYSDVKLLGAVQCEQVCAEARGSPSGSSHHAAPLLGSGLHTAAIMVVAHTEVVANLVGHSGRSTDGQLWVVLRGSIRWRSHMSGS